jgi:transposase
MDRVVIGVDPHKLSVTIEARDNREILRATGQFRTDARSYHQLLEVARQWPERVWAVEGANGIGRPLTQRLLASGERVLDVPAKLAARARVSGTGQVRKTDATDAHAIVMIALRDRGLREVRADPELALLRMLCDRRNELSRARNQARSRLHRLFADLIPGGAPVKKSTRQYQALLATVRPRDLAGQTRRRMAAEELEDLHRLDAKLKTMKTELKAAVAATGSHLMDIHGIGPAGAARILADVGDVSRVPRPQPFRVPGRHRLPRRLQRPAHPPPALARREPPAQPRALHRRDRPAPPRHPRPGLLPAQTRRREDPDRSHALPAAAPVRPRRLPATGRRRPQPATSEPGRHPGASLSSSAAGLSPDTGTSDQPLPGPAHPTLPPPRPASQAMTPAAAIPQAARPRCQRAAPHRTNDVDTDQRRRTLKAPGAVPLTNPFIEGSHNSNFST